MPRMWLKFLGRDVKLSDYVELNPRVTLPRDANVPFVNMDIVTPGTRRVYPVQERPATGSGSKFAPGDTLFARITPCLENGKIAQYAGDRPGMGSTEFFVLRARDGISDPAYVYYCSQNQDLRSVAEKSMSGASGRQRAVISSLSEFECEFPPLAVQQRIASILSAYDELIENSQRRIKILESMARGLYREWFVHFRFPGHENHPRVASALGEIPQGWVVVAFTALADVLSGGTPKTDIPEYWNGDIPFFTPKDAPSCFYVEDAERLVTELGLSKCASALYPPDTVFITARGTVGKVAMPSVPMAMSQSCYALRGKHGCTQRFLFLMTIHQVDYLKTNTGGATFDTIVVDTFRRMKVAKPPLDLITSFTRKVDALLEQVKVLQGQVRNLRRTRDLLLPRLLSGQINVEAP